MNRPTLFPLEVALLTTNPEAALHASEIPLFETETRDEQDDIPIFASEAVLNDESKACSSKAAAAGHDEAPVEHETRHIEICGTNGKELIPWEAKSIAKELAKTEL